MCPGNNERASKRKSGTIRRGSRSVATGADWKKLHEAARQQANLRWHNFGVLLPGAAEEACACGGWSCAVGCCLSHILTRKEPYRDLGANFFDERDRPARLNATIRRLERLGYQVKLVP